MTIEKILHVIKVAFLVSIVLSYLTIMTAIAVAAPLMLLFIIPATLGIATLILSIAADDKKEKEINKNRLYK